ncbi:MmyB family transcriptional regulator, partial [Patulibacter sp. S7RM1-6]
AGTLRLLAAMDGVPAVLLGRRNDVLGWNALGHALLAGHCARDAPGDPASRPNLTRMLFLDPHTRELHARWEEEAARSVATLRLIAGRHPDDAELAGLIGELTVRSAEFAALWAAHPVATCSRGVKRFRHPDVGELELGFEALELPDADGQRLLAYTAPGGGPAAGLELLRRIAGDG